MTILLGLIITLGCLLGGFVAMGGHVGVIFAPWYGVASSAAMSLF